MWICICNAFNEEEIDKAIKDGAQTPLKVLNQCGGVVCCGACIPAIQKRINELEEDNGK